MRSNLSLNSIRKRRRRVVRLIALLFVLYTGADILLPQYFCGGEEVGDLPLQSVVLASSSAKPDTANAISEPDNSQTGESQDQAPHEEDCFCCCAHVLPGMGFTACVSARAINVSAIPIVNSPPSPELPNAYRPPRFA